MLTWLAITAIGITSLAHFGSIGILAGRIRGKRAPVAFDGTPPSVSIVRPICGLENYLEECIASSFQLTYANYEVLFCADDENDSAIPLVRRFMEQYPEVDARLVTGRDRIGLNPKLNNVVKGFREARSDWIIMNDSNAVLKPDYVEQLLACWGANTGVVSTATIVDHAENFAADLECAFMNALQARWVLAADSIGVSFALGKSLMYHRATFEGLGGLPRLAEYSAEDIATTHLMRGAGLGIKLAQDPVRQPIGRRPFKEVVARQVRWARFRRTGFRGLYAVEPLNGGFVPMLSVVGLAAGGTIAWWMAAAFAALWYGAEALLPRAIGWPSSHRTLGAILLRDLLLPAIWLTGLFGNKFEWRGNTMTVARPRRGEAPAVMEAEQG